MNLQPNHRPELTALTLVAGQVVRQLIVLANELGTVIHAVDFHEPFLNDLVRRAKEARIEHLVQTHCMDMKSLPGVFQHIDLLRSEGAAHCIGVSNAKCSGDSYGYVFYVLQRA
jgi:hypothetical protein